MITTITATTMIIMIIIMTSSNDSSYEVTNPTESIPEENPDNPET